MSEHESLDWGNFNYEQKIILEKTGCKIPCTHYEYEVVGEPQSGNKEMIAGDTGYVLQEALIMNLLHHFLFSSSYFFGFNFASTDVSVKKEGLTYPPVSFISELGGSLGLFVGFSFLTLWDWIDFLIAKSKSYKDYLQ